MAALDFDLACTLRLMQFDNQVAETQAKMLAYEVAKTLFGEGNS